MPATLADQPVLGQGDEATEAPPLLTTPSGGVPCVVDTPAALNRTVAALRDGSGPVAVDAERAHGFRYSQRAYLVQLRRAGAGTHLVDPVAFGQPADLTPLAEAIADEEWVIHAASQDLPCLVEVGMSPKRLFDTELAARLLNYPRVALGTMLEELCGVRLLKEHSAADWSTRPLPAEWLTYAALDVELLVELRDRLAADLDAAGKRQWADQEFAWLVATAGVPAETRVDPWRRTSGIHQVRGRRGLAVVRELWQARDDIARESDRAPSKVLLDSAISELAGQARPDRAALRGIPAFARRQARRFEAAWLDALTRVAGMRESDLPPLHLVTDGPPQPRAWAAKDPVAAGRLARSRQAIAARAVELDLPTENLLTPDHLRRLAWRPPTEITEETVDAVLAGLGSRPWQREQTVPLITPLLVVTDE